MGDSQASQNRFDSDASDKLWEVVEIVSEKSSRGGKMYKVNWAGVDPGTGKPWPPSWVPSKDCTPDLVKEWKQKKLTGGATKKQRKRSAGASESTSTSRQTSVASTNTVASSSKTLSKVASASISRKRKMPFAEAPSPKRFRSAHDESGREEASGLLPSPRLPKKPAHTRFVKTKDPDKGEDLFASDASDDFPTPLPMHPVKFGPPKGRKSLKQRLPGITLPSLSADMFNITESQRLALRQEEEETSQEVESSRSKRPVESTKTKVNISMRSSISQEEEESQVSALVVPLSPKDTRQHPAESRDANPATEKRTPQSLLPSANHGEERPRPRSETQPQLISTAEDEDDNISITSQANPPPTPPRISKSPEAPSPPLARRIPQIPTSAFAPFLPGNISIDDFSSPIKRPAPSQQSTVQDWSISADDNSISHERPTERNIDQHERGLELARKFASARRAANAPAQRQRVVDIIRNRTKVSLFPLLANGRSSKSLPHNSPPDVLRALEPTQVTNTQGGIESVDIALQDDDDDAAVRRMEEQYVDLRGGAGADGSPKAVDELAISQEVIPPSDSAAGEDSSQSQPSQQPITVQEALAQAMSLLSERSEEIKQLKSQVEERDAKAEDTLARFEAERSEWQSKEAAWTAEGATLRVTWEQKGVSWAETERRLRARIGELEKAHTDQEAALAAAKAKAVSEENNVEMFRKLYMEGTAYVTDTRAENEALKQRAMIAEGQARHGVALIRAEAEARIAKLEDDVKREQSLVALLTERARRTDDAVRERAALEPEWRRRIGVMEERFDQRDADADDLEYRLKKLRRQVDALEDENRRIKLAFMRGASRKQSAQDIEDGDSEEDSDYVAPSSSSSESDSEISGSVSEAEIFEEAEDADEDAEGSIDRDIDGAVVPASEPGMTPVNGRWMCDWAPGTADACQADLSSRNDLLKHYAESHAAPGLLSTLADP